MRAAFLALLLVNLMYLAWAVWIDVPALPPDTTAVLPRLRLVTEPSLGNPPAARRISAPDLTASTIAPPSEITTAAQCVSVGPFNNDADVARASAFLRSQQLQPRERVVQSPPVRWYWVYLHDPGSAAGMKQVLQRLKRAGIQGAAPIAMAGEQRLSLGMFQDPKLARQQQRLAREKGFQPVLTERLVSKPAYWLDVWVVGATNGPPLEALKAEAGTPIAWQSCPPGETPAGQPDTPQAVSPGLPAPEATATAAPSSPAAPPARP